MAITTKEQMYGMYQGGAFGNRLQSWSSVAEYLESNFDGLVVIRSKTPGGVCHYGLCRDMARQYLTIPGLVVSELADDKKLVLQGEVMRTPLGLHLMYSTVPKPMRQALQQQREFATGLTAKIILESRLDAQSFDELMDMLDKYEDHVVEFSTYSVDVGCCLRRNTVFWEVRAY
jgi:hypothetical protein